MDTEERGISMEHKPLHCPACKSTKGKEVSMIEKHDTLACPECRLVLLLSGKSPLGRYAETWRTSAEELFPLLRPPVDEFVLLNTRVHFLYEDCYYTLLIGRYNASIVLMGVLLEALMKERIGLKLGIEFKGTYGSCLRTIKSNTLMQAEDIQFLERFKDEIRNPYQHADEVGILQGLLVPVWPMEIQGELSFEKINTLMDNAKSGKMKPKLLPASEIPAIRSVVKQEYDRKRAIDLFNSVYDFLIGAEAKYFKQEDYDEHNRKFGTGLEKVPHYKV